MDINEIVFSETSKLTVYNPITKENTDIEIEVYSLDTKQGQKAQRDFVVAQVAARAIEDELEQEQMIENAAIAFIADLTKDWKNITENGKKLECNKDNAIYLYSKVKYIFNQVDRHINNTGNFYKVQNKS